MPCRQFCSGDQHSHAQHHMITAVADSNMAAITTWGESPQSHQSPYDGSSGCCTESTQDDARLLHMQTLRPYSSASSHLHALCPSVITIHCVRLRHLIEHVLVLVLHEELCGALDVHKEGVHATDILYVNLRRLYSSSSSSSSSSSGGIMNINIMTCSALGKNARLNHASR